MELSGRRVLTNINVASPAINLSLNRSGTNMIASDGDTAQQNGVVVVDSFGDEIGVVGKVCVPAEQAVAA